MDGLDDQAEQELRSIRDNLYSQNVVEIKHSSRDNLMARVFEILCSSDAADDNDNPSQTIQATSLVFRSGLSLTSLALLKAALSQPACRGIHELEFVNLWNMDQIRAALRMVRRQPDQQQESENNSDDDDGGEDLQHQYQENNKDGATIRTLKFTSFRPRERMRRPGKILAELFCHEFFDYAQQRGCYDHVNEFHLHAYPIGSVGSQVLAPAVAENTTLRVLRLQDCDLQSDSATSVAQMIRYNTTLQVLDLSDNPYYLASALTWEMTVKVLVRQGLQHNTTLLDLPLMVTRRSGEKKVVPSRAKLDKHLKLNRFAHAYFVATALPETAATRRSGAPRRNGSTDTRPSALQGRQDARPSALQGRQQETKDATTATAGSPTRNHRCASMELNPALWPKLLGRAAIKPSILHRFVQDCVTVLYS